MDTNSDDFKTIALRCLASVNTWRLTARERDILWRLAFGPAPPTARDFDELARLTQKLNLGEVAS